MTEPPLSDPAARAAAAGSGSAPKDEFAPLVPELAVSDLQHFQSG